MEYLKILFGILVLEVTYVHGDIKDDCLPSMVYLKYSEKCVWLGNGITSYLRASMLCKQWYGVGELLDFSKLSEGDSLTFHDSLVQMSLDANATEFYEKRVANESVSLWTNANKSLSCDYISINADNVSFTYSGNCSTDERYFFCTVSAFTSRLGLQSSKVCDKFLNATSFYKDDYTMLQFRPEFARYNTSFSLGLYTGKGWCLRSLEGEYFEINFYSDAVISGILVQPGEINSNCLHWTTRFSLKYKKQNQWTNLLQNENYLKTFNFSSEVQWFNRTLMQALRVFPLAAENSCNSTLEVYCMRFELFGMFTGYNARHLLEPSQPTATSLPANAFALPKPSTGCLRSNISGGHMFFKTTPLSSNVTKFSIETDNLTSKIEVCIYDSATSIPGDYCVYLIGTQCLSGFYRKKVRLHHAFVLTDSPGYDSSLKTLSFCCRNTTNSTNHIFQSEPFFLLPISRTCPFFQNTYSSLEHFTSGLQNNTYIHDNQTPMEFLNNTLTSWFCFYEPDNFADKILFELHGTIHVNLNETFHVDIRLLRNGLPIRHGKDSSLAMSVTRLSKAQEEIHTIKNGHLSLTFFSGSVTNETLFFSLTTSLGITANHTISVVTYRSFNNLFYLSDNFHERLAITVARKSSTLQKENYGNFSVGDIDSLLSQPEDTRPDVVHALLNGDNVYKLVSETLASKIPLFLFDTDYANEVDIPSMSHVRFISIPQSMRSFVNFVTSQASTRYVIIYRTKHTVSSAELYYLSKSRFRLKRDIILTREVTPQHVDILKDYKSAAVFVFLDSALASQLLVMAIKQGVTPQQGYAWYSFASNFIVSNTFISSKCQSVKPACHVAFADMGNIHRESSACSNLQLKGSIDNLTAFDESIVYNSIANDMIHEAEEIRAKSLQQKATFGAIFKNKSDSKCLASGSGFVFVRQPFKLDYARWLCQASWSGAKCNLPTCSAASCNRTHGICIAPEVCYCHAGTYGRGCNQHCSAAGNCVHGVCNDGLLGDGKCRSCDWLYSGEYCDENSIIWRLIAAGIGSFVMLFFIALYVLKLFQTQEQTAEAQSEAVETDYTMKFEDMDHIEEVEFSHEATRKHLTKKFEHCRYKKGTTFSGKNVFMKCYTKPYLQLSLDQKTELQRLCRIEHPNVEKLLGVIIQNPYIGVVGELAPMGSLYDVLHEKHIQMTWEARFSMLQDICRGMIHLHGTVKMKHGKLKSPNCLVHHGWLVKISDIGLRKIRKKEKSSEPTTGEKKHRRSRSSTDEESDYNSLLWTAPEFICTGVKSLDQIFRKTREGDVYSFGIILAEIITRAPPYAEIGTMSISHIIQAVGRLKAPIVNLGQLNNLKGGGDGNTANKLQQMQDCLIRPTVQDTMLPDNEGERSTLKVLMEGCWAEEAEDRPPFCYCLEVLDLITPLKGSQTKKRALLLQRETESLEKYIAHDTNEIFKEKGKIADLLSRIIPPRIAADFNKGNYIDPVNHEAITVMTARLENLTELLLNSSPQQAVGVIDAVWKLLPILTDTRKLNITEINCRGDLFVVGSGLRNQYERHAWEMSFLASKFAHAVKKTRIPHMAKFRLAVKIGVHSGPATSGIIIVMGTPKYVVIGDAVKIASALEVTGRKNMVHTTKKTVSMLSHNEFQIIARNAFKLQFGKVNLKTYWVSLM